MTVERFDRTEILTGWFDSDDQFVLACDFDAMCKSLGDPNGQLRQELIEDLFNRQTYVIEYLQDVGRGKKPIPTADECKKLAIKLGNAKWRSARPGTAAEETR